MCIMRDLYTQKRPACLYANLFLIMKEESQLAANKVQTPPGVGGQWGILKGLQR